MAQSKEYRRQYYLAHKEKVLQQSHENYKLNKVKRLQQQREYKKKNPDKVKQWEKNYKQRNKTKLRVQQYGLTEQQYEQLKIEQDNKCAICRRPIDIFCVDHDHSTDMARGLLCNQCNSMIGFAGDNTQILLNAIEYLEKHKVESN
jgi:hypothetical protein